MKLLCYLGLHKYKKRIVSHGFSSNVYDVTLTCERCGKKKRKIETKK